MSNVAVPTYQDILWPTLKALEAKAGSASNEELSEAVAELMNLSDAVLEASHNDGPLSKVDYRAAWARSHLKFIGAIDNSARGVWTITEFGRDIKSEEEARSLVREARANRRKARRPQKANSVDDDGEDETSESESWEDSLLAVLRKLTASAFERLCQRMLRESGFTKVEVTGRSGDGGIDGTGVLRVNLLSFHVRFQCKRYTGTVTPSEIRDFRGAMIGRADKGLFITTGRFTKEAAREAIRDGAPAIDLIDGVELCHLLKQLQLGVQVETVERVSPFADFFENL